MNKDKIKISLNFNKIENNNKEKLNETENKNEKLDLDNQKEKESNSLKEEIKPVIGFPLKKEILNNSSSLNKKENNNLNLNEKIIPENKQKINTKINLDKFLDMKDNNKSEINKNKDFLYEEISTKKLLNLKGKKISKSKESLTNELLSNGMYIKLKN